MSSTIRFGGSNKDDIFGKIKGLITDMITKLETEAEEAATEHAFCEKEMSETNAKKDDKTDEIEKLTAKIDKMTGKSKILKAEVGELTKSQGEMARIRQEEKTLFEANEAELSK